MTAHRYVHQTNEPFGLPCLAIPTEFMPDLSPYGWAPGGYMIKCAECDSEFGPDKLRHMGESRSSSLETVCTTTPTFCAGRRQLLSRVWRSTVDYVGEGRAAKLLMYPTAAESLHESRRSA